MTAQEHEITIEIACTHPPRAAWAEGGTLHIGIQQGDAVVDSTPVSRNHLIFHPLLRVRRHADGSANFLGPFAHGPRAGRFIYLNWIVMKDGAVVTLPGRIKLQLNHLPWRRVELAISTGKPIKVAVALSDAGGKPVFASVRTGVHWDI